MNLDFSYALELPGAYFLAMVTLFALLAEAAARWQEKWAVPTIMVYMTIFGWYMMEPLNSPETFATFSDQEISSAYISVFIFLVALRMLATILTSMLVPKTVNTVDIATLPADRVFWLATITWLILAAIGISRMNGDVMASLFPLEARNQVTMWQRAAGSAAGTFGFAVSIASYLYVLVLAIFGMLLPLLKTKRTRALCVLIILISWPYAFLQGSRNITLAVFIPMMFSFFFFSKLRLPTKMAIGIGGFSFIEWALRQIITYRNVGFDYTGDVKDAGHLGLNMASELVYANSFINSGILDLKWGMGLLAELSNLLPRFVWPDKPLLGIDYAIARGFSGGGGDIGVFATISTGLIGQGVLEFGPFVGPAVMALFMAIWVAFLARLWAQGTVPRVCLFLVGMGLTFNMGRNLTLLVLWPMVFAYVTVVLIEKLSKKPRAAPPATGSVGLA